MTLRLAVIFIIYNESPSVSTRTAEGLTSVFQTIYNFKANCNQNMLHKLKNKRKCKANITAKHNSIMQNLRDFDNLHPN